MREPTRERDVFPTLYADTDRVGTIACIPGERPARIGDGAAVRAGVRLRR